MQDEVEASEDAYHCSSRMTSTHFRVRIALLILAQQRYRVPLDAAPNAVPDFTDDEIWYNYVGSSLVIVICHQFEFVIYIPFVALDTTPVFHVDGALRRVRPCIKDSFCWFHTESVVERLIC